MALIDNLISYWKLDEASGSALDAHGSHNLAELGGTMGAVTGKISGARDFEADDTESFRVANHADLQGGDTDFTIQAWVKVESTGASRRIIAKWEGGGVLEYLLELASVNQFRFFVSNNGSASVSVTATNFGTPSLDTWYLIHAWHDSVNNEIGISVNAGTPNTTSHSTGVFAGTSGFNIGGSGSGAGSGNGFDGAIDEAGFWRKVLTSDERTALYNGGNGRAYPFTINDVITASCGSFTLTGHTASLRVARVIVAGVGSFAVAGNDADLAWLARIVAETGSFLLTGSAASITSSGEIVPIIPARLIGNWLIRQHASLSNQLIGDVQ